MWMYLVYIIIINEINLNHKKKEQLMNSFSVCIHVIQSHFFVVAFLK